MLTRALHSTSDFPLILGDAVNREMRAAYNAAPSGVRQVAKQSTARDFRAKRKLTLGAAPKLERVGEGGEFKSGTIDESQETYSIETFGKIIGITRQVMVNDDLGAFTDLPRRMPQKKTGFQPWCPIFPELEAEMTNWEKRPGPYLIQETGKGAGKPFSTNQLWKELDKAREKHPELEGAVWHGLRANAVIRLRQANYTGQQISDMVGMSIEMIERYCRHADRKAGGQAVLREIKERNKTKAVKL